MIKTKPIPRLTPEQIERFWSKVDQRGPKDCWEWQAACNSKGYGHIGFSPCGSFLSHRLAYSLAYGRDPGQLCVCHDCDNRRCCNPAHLFLGTCADNSADMREKGRGSAGEAHAQAKLTARSVRAIRDSDKPRRVLADRYGITQSTVWDIQRNRTWRHLSDRTSMIRNLPCGNCQPRAKLTEDRVRRIRRSNQTVAALAKQYRVAPSTIRDALNGRTWVTVA
jgi:hypothetical protein